MAGEEEAIAGLRRGLEREAEERRRIAAERDEIAAERDRLLDALAESHRSVEDLRRRVTAAHRHRAANQENLVRAYSSLADARDELQKIRSSKLWRIATGYWRLREILRLNRGRAGPDPSAAVPTGEPSAAGGAPVPGAPPPGPARHDIVCFPIIEWEFRFQRPQQLLSRFAAAGHRVFYLSQRFRQKGAPWEIVERAENVFEVTLFGPGMNVYRSAPSASAVDLLFFSLDALRRDAAVGPAAALGASSPGRSSTTAWTSTPGSRRTRAR
jgi:hypothetical protein